MLYLIIAEHMGIIGLLLFLGVMTAFFIQLFRAWRNHAITPGNEAILLGLSGAVLGALVSGIFDHYWFNMSYPHMTVLFWLHMGLAATSVSLGEQHSMPNQID